MESDLLGVGTDLS